jgi:hypothetical protein
MTQDNPWLDLITTPFNACSLETITPIRRLDDAAIPLVVGCYQLNESSNRDHENDEATRSGQLRLYMIRNGEQMVFGEPYVVPMESGVLDGKWKRCGERSLFASACASGRIHLHSLERDSNAQSWSLNHEASSNIGDERSALCLSLAWNACEDADNQMTSSYSDGTVALHRVKISNSTEISIQECQRWDAHSLFGCPSEVWTCSYLRGEKNVVLSGADDVSFGYASDLIIVLTYFSLAFIFILLSTVHTKILGHTRDIEANRNNIERI